MGLELLDLLLGLAECPPVGEGDQKGLDEDEQDQRQRSEHVPLDADPRDAEVAHEKREHGDDAQHEELPGLALVPELAQTEDAEGDTGDDEQHEDHADHASEDVGDDLPAAAVVVLVLVGVVATEERRDDDVAQRHDERGEPESPAEQSMHGDSSDCADGCLLCTYDTRHHTWCA